MLSDFLDHDHHAMQHFFNIAVKHLCTTRQLNIECVHEWMDGCAAQYKSGKGAIIVSCSQSDYGFNRRINFFGSEHGKGESAGVTVNVKCSIDMAVLGERAVIRNASECYHYCVEHFSSPKHHNKDDIAVESLKHTF